MPQFNMYLDQKVTTWMRTEFNVEADSLEEAKVMAVAKLELGLLNELGWEEVADSKEVMLPIENYGNSTAELYYRNDDLLGNEEFYTNKLN